MEPEWILEGILEHFMDAFKSIGKGTGIIWTLLGLIDNIIEIVSLIDWVNLLKSCATYKYINIFCFVLFFLIKRKKSNQW